MRDEEAYQLRGPRVAQIRHEEGEPAGCSPAVFGLREQPLAAHTRGQVMSGSRAKSRFMLVVGLSMLGILVGGYAGASGFRTFLFAFPGHDIGWHAREGLPENRGGSNHALHMARTDPAATGQAGAVIDGAEGITLTELGFDYKNGEHCTVSAPRLLVRTEPDGDRYSFGCAQGIHTPAPADMLNWTRVRFTDADAALVEGTTPWPGFNNVAVRSLVVLFDELGVVHLDNLDVNGILIGKPGNND